VQGIPESRLVKAAVLEEKPLLEIHELLTRAGFQVKRELSNT
jgi:hypothetical protein